MRRRIPDLAAANPSINVCKQTIKRFLQVKHTLESIRVINYVLALDFFLESVKSRSFAFPRSTTRRNFFRDPGEL